MPTGLLEQSSISTEGTNIKEVNQNVRRRSEIAIGWLKASKMFVNLNKFQAIVVKRNH